MVDCRVMPVFSHYRGTAEISLDVPMLARFELKAAAMNLWADSQCAPD